MKKTLLVISLFLSTKFIAFAQFKVQDTLLLAFGNQIFWSASSELQMDFCADFGLYGSTNLSDNDPSTCWAEGSKSDGSEEYIWMTLPKGTKNLRIKNGYQKNDHLYFANNRAKSLELELYACFEPPGYVTESHNGFFISRPIASSIITLEDIIGCQDLNLDFEWSTIDSLLKDHAFFEKDRYMLKIIIKDVYKGNKWNDLCISDINIVLNPYFDITSNEHGLLKIIGSKKDTLFYNTESVYQLVTMSPDNQWIIFMVMPSDIEYTRVETEYELYNTKKEQFVELENLPIIYGFVKESGKLYLEGSDKDFNDKKILLEEL